MYVYDESLTYFEISIVSESLGRFLFYSSSSKCIVQLKVSIILFNHTENINELIYLYLATVLILL